MEGKYTNEADLDYFLNNVVEKNFVELVSFLEELSEDNFSQDNTLLTTNNELDTGKRSEANEEFSRLFYNYIISSLGLIEQMEDFSADIEDEKEDIFIDGRWEFLRELRNFLVHRTKPPLDSKEVGGEIFGWKKRKFQVFLDEGFLTYLDDYLNDSERKKPIRKYLDGRKTVDAELELRKFHKSLKELHKKAI